MENLKKKDFLSQGARIKKYELKQQNVQFLKQELQEAEIAQDKSFLATGRHKVESQFGMKIFDTLANLRRKSLSEVKPVNDVFLKGMSFTFSFFPDFNSDQPKIQYETNKQLPKPNRNITLKLEPEFLLKMNQACNGGTEEKKKFLLQNQGRIAKNPQGESSDDDSFDMFDSKRYEENEMEPDLEYGQIDKGNAKAKENLILTDRLKQELALQKQQEDGVKTEMGQFRSNLLSGGQLETEEDGYYQECFPMYEENEFQDSIKDNLGKKGPDNKQSRLNGQVNKRLKTGAEKFQISPIPELCHQLHAS